MPRQARLDAPGLLYHVIGRGIERNKIYSDDRDRLEFLDRLGEVAIDTSTPIYAFALIPNHFHLLMRRGGAPLSRVMQRILTGYALYFNRKHHRRGHLFQNRYKSIVCQEEPYFLELIRYIHLNPIRAGLVSSVEHLKDYHFSGHSFLIGKRKAQWFDRLEVMGRFANTEAKANQAYVAFLNDGLNIKIDLTGGGLQRSLSPADMSKKDYAFDDRILGEASCVENLLQQEERVEVTENQGGADPKEQLDLICQQTGVSLVEMRSEAKRPNVARSRALVSFRLAHYGGQTGRQIADIINVTPSAVSRLIVKGRILDR